MRRCYSLNPWIFTHTSLNVIPEEIDDETCFEQISLDRHTWQDLKAGHTINGTARNLLSASTINHNGAIYHQVCDDLCLT
ncbi:unnamed protein product [Thelazia callipaeda]|uniref:Transposase n=1 Tax=Thelazia callipaeda TaxID=103827 RepID=A0A0N5CX27_THECL|nr:unnamed protein product [Thelazia callipaeda]